MLGLPWLPCMCSVIEAPSMQLENIRRKHNYLPLIMEVLKILAKRGELVGLVDKVRGGVSGTVLRWYVYVWWGGYAAFVCYSGKEEEG